MTTPFRLFSLPFVPLKQVLDNFGPPGIIILSLCSLRSKSIAVSYRGPSKDVLLTLNFGLESNLEVTDKTYSQILFSLLRVKEIRNLPINQTTLETVRIGSFESVPVNMENGYWTKDNLITYWEDRTTGLTAIGDYGREIFNRDIDEVMIGEKQEEDDHRRAAEWVTKSQGTIQSLFCNFDSEIDNDIDFVLENFKYTHSLFFFVRPSEHYNPARMPNFQVDNLHILYSFWIKQDHLLTMNCKFIFLSVSKLTSRDLNMFVKHWMAGGCSKLIELHVSVEEPIDYQIVLGGVEFEEIKGEVERVFVEEDRTPHTIIGGFDVKRSNVTATVVGSPGDEFWMIVW